MHKRAAKRARCVRASVRLPALSVGGAQFERLSCGSKSGAAFPSAVVFEIPYNIEQRASLPRSSPLGLPRFAFSPRAREYQRVVGMGGAAHECER